MPTTFMTVLGGTGASGLTAGFAPGVGFHPDAGTLGAAAARVGRPSVAAPATAPDAAPSLKRARRESNAKRSSVLVMAPLSICSEGPKPSYLLADPRARRTNFRSLNPAQRAGQATLTPKVGAPSALAVGIGDVIRGGPPACVCYSPIEGGGYSEL